MFGWTNKVVLNVPVISLLVVIIYIGCGYVMTHIFRLLQTDRPAGPKILRWEKRGYWHLGVFSVLSLLFLYCLTRAFLMDPGPVQLTASGKVVETELKESKKSGSVRFCKWCHRIKPDRAHHCSRCKKCVLRMDHHCPWINNCVGHSNYKYFFLAILYGFLDCVWVGISSTDTLIFYHRAQTGVLRLSRIWMFTAMYFLDCVMGCLLSFYLTFLLINAGHNQTTLEFCEKSSKARIGSSVNWDVGWYRNLQQVLGPTPLVWLLPIDFGRGDGMSFPTHDEAELTAELLQH